MKKIEKINSSNTPIVRIDNSLKKYKDQPLFQDKLENANKVLTQVGLPKKA